MAVTCPGSHSVEIPMVWVLIMFNFINGLAYKGWLVVASL